MNSMTNRLRALACAIALSAVPARATAQFPAPPDPVPAPAAKPAPKAPPKPVERPKPRPARPGEAMTDPIKCWWKTNTTEVRIGQRFTVILTCGVIETPSLKVIANTNALDPGAVQLTPFEVAGGVRHEDILSPPWRYLQYEYQVRLLSEGFFGKDVMLPSLRVTYNLQAASGGAEGRDLTYQLPQLPMRIASLVPAGATDIRDVSNENFSLIESRRFRASTATVVGGILLGFAAVLLLIAVARAFGRVRARRPILNKPLAPVTVLGGALRTLAAVKADAAREGWSPALVCRAQAAVRLAAAVGLNRSFAQATVAGRPAERDGQITITQGLFRRRRIVVSAAPTGATVARALADDPGIPAKTRASLETLRTALNVFTAAAYGKPGELETTALDRSLGDSLDAVKQMRMRSLLPFGHAPSDTSVTGLGSPSITGDQA